MSTSGTRIVGAFVLLREGTMYLATPNTLQSEVGKEQVQGSILFVRLGTGNALDLLSEERG